MWVVDYAAHEPLATNSWPRTVRAWEVDYVAGGLCGHEPLENARVACHEAMKTEGILQVIYIGKYVTGLCGIHLDYVGVWIM